MLVCGFDVETTGLETQKDRVIEIGAVLFDSDSWTEVSRFSSLVWEPGFPKITEEVERVTGINREMLEAGAESPIVAWVRFLMWAKDAQAVVAHNKAFDSALAQAEIKRLMLFGEPESDNFLSVPWLCSIQDLKSNREKKCMKLSHLALDYGVAVDPKGLHRAVNDVELMGRMLKEAGAKVEEMIRYMEMPNVIIQALVPKPWDDGGKGKDAAKSLGYSWQQPKGTDRFFKDSWVKVIKADEFEVEQMQAPFKIRSLS